MQDRNHYPRVTTVLHEGFVDGDLAGWAIKEAFRSYCRLWDDHVGSTGKDPDRDEIIAQAKRASGDIMRTAARRGTAVHHLIEGKTREELSVEEGDWDSIEPMYESFLKWAKERNFRPVANEVPVWSDKHGYRGTLDCIGEVDGVMTLLDWKTSNSIRLGYRLQLAAYWYAYKESCQNPEDVKLIRIVRFGGRSDKGGQTKDLVEYEELIIDGEEEISIDFNAFLAAKRLHDWKLKRK